MFTLAVMQSTASVDQIEINLTRIDTFAEEAHGSGAQLLVTPELFASGYAPSRVADSDGETVRNELSGIARRHGIALVGSSVERTASGRHICASFFDQSGNELARYRKAHLFGDEEKSVFVPGDRLPTLFGFGGCTIALGICYDIEFPEFVRRAALQGADVLCVPTAVPTTGDIGGSEQVLTYNAERISTLMVPTRALENGVYIAYANHAAPDFTGRSVVVSPYGTELAGAAGGEQLLLASIDEAEVVRARRINTYLDDVRPELYTSSV